ncbi:hypothetical protein EYC84_002934 [Monilinia fructicola]|uniref:Uncharacterized protein n=1 Tax=Monilinia fructicola TaxID=38448 RepID=A0A5M9JS26_MONFR|nr:hypothetical protein EYC84_002934 [Monilinia fructicola]
MANNTAIPRGDNSSVPGYNCIRQDLEHRSTGHISIHDLCNTTLPEAMIVFLPSEKSLIHLKLDKQLSDRFMIPNSFWDSVSQEASGFFRCQESRNVDDVLEAYTQYDSRISAVFSTSFFNFSPGNSTEPQRWMVSDKFWIYWAVTIPMTLATILLWLSWQSLDQNRKWDRR